MNWNKLILWLAAIIIIVGIVGLVAVKALISPQAITQAIVPKISAMLDREVKVGSAELSLFPVGVSIRDVTILNKEPIAQRQLARVDRLDANLQYLPLLLGRIKVKEVQIHGWEMMLYKDSSGVVNYDFFTARAMLPDRKQQFEEPLCRRFHLDDGRLLLRDDSTGFRMLMGDVSLNYDLRGERHSDISGELKIDSLFIWTGGSSFLLSPQAFEADWRGYYSQAKDSLAFRKCNWRLDRFAGRLDGAIGALSITPSLDLRVLSERTELAQCADSRLIAAIPFLRDLQLTGQVRVDVAYSGVAGIPSSRSLRGKISVTDFAGVLPEKNVDLRMKLLEANFNERTLSLFTEAGFIGSSPASFRFTVDEYSDPTYSGEINIASDAATLARIFDADPALAFDGQVEANLSGFVKPSVSEQGRVFGSMRILNGSVSDSAARWAIDTLNAEIQFSGSEAQLPQVSLAIGPNALQFNGTITDFPLILTQRAHLRKRPRFEFSLAADNFDFDTLRVIGMSGSPSGDTGTVMRSLDLLVDFDATGRVQISVGRIAGMNLENLQASMSVTNRIVYSDTLSANALGGSVSGEVVYDLSRLLSPDFEYDLKGHQISAAQLLQQFTNAGETLSGDVDIQLVARGRGLSASEIGPSLNIKGQAVVEDGRVTAFDFSRGFEQYFGIPALDGQKADNLVCTFMYADQTLRFNRLEFDSDDIEYLIEGTITRDGITDLLINRKLSKDDNRFLSSNEEYRSLAGGKQPKWATFRAAGPASSPVFNVVSVRQKD